MSDDREGESSDVCSPGDAVDPGWQYKRGDRSRRNGPLRRRFRDLRRRVLSPLVPLLVPPLLRGLGWTWRVQVANSERREELLESGEGCVAVLWHGRMAAAAPVFAGVNTVILVSMSGDGELANTTLERLGYRTLRGSSSRYGVRALKAMREMLRGGGAVAITPDGPRGPMHRVNRGAAFLARDAGLPIVPFGFAAASAARLNSWDRFTLPLPFSRVQVVIGAPISVDRGATDEDLRAVSQGVGDALVAAEVEAASLLGVGADW
ncbi:lysophospholipid acyltransferase family protein [Planctomycetota bacterium]|jgi:lysophospholipid acyltransferase (LPLAT)-like uncharacterized protein|nr:lysophospholipid acyltransferase family protein [bacterium]MDB2575676.1 lysophospholipid acyltransferase family protein [Planctomycetota bacterium]MDB4489469.1 lysophospholipid acyltransferase family protein [bacterium]MDB4559477.1 lysophospholipid acyltransferase family protein [Planctomycetota bacterium]